MREIALLLDAGDVAAIARGVRELKPETLAGYRSPKPLRRAAALLRAASYSCTVAALNLERRAMELDGTQPVEERIGETERQDRPVRR